MAYSGSSVAARIESRLAVALPEMPILLPLLAVLIPILILPSCLFYFDITPKVAILLLGATLACGMVVRNTRSLRILWSSPNGRKIVLLFCVLAAVTVISTIGSSMQALSVSGGNWRRYGLITQLSLLAFTLLVAAELHLKLRNTLRAIAISGSLISLYTVMQYFGWDPLLPSASYHIGEGIWTIVRPPGTIGHADYLGCYLVFMVFLGGSLIVREECRWWRLVGGLTAAIGSFAVLLSGTRSAILGIVVGCALLAFRLRPNLRQTAAALCLMILVLGAFYVSPLGLKLRGRTRWYVEDPVGGARLLLWRDSMRMAADRPVIGWGPETFSTEFAHFQSLELSRAFPDFYHESPHNIFVDELVSKGIVGAMTLLAFCGWAAMAAWRALKRRQDAPIGAAFLAGLATLQFNSFVVTTAFFCFLTGVVLLASELGEVAQTEPSGPRWQWPVAIGGIALALVFAIFAVRLCVGDNLLARVKKRLDAADVMAASSLYESCRKWQPPGVNSDLYYSRHTFANQRKQRELMASVKAFQEAVQAGIRATQSGEDRQNAYYHLASIYAQVNNFVDAERNLRAAVHSSPNWFKPHWMLAKALDTRGRHAEAVVEAELAVERDGGKHPEVGNTLLEIRKTVSGRELPSAK